MGHSHSSATNKKSKHDKSSKRKTNTASVPPPNHMKSEGNLSSNWCEWKQNFEIYLTVLGLNGKNNDYTCALFLHHIGQYGRDIFNTLEIKKPYSLQELFNNFEQHCNPKTNTFTNNHLFFTTVQKPGQSIESFLETLHQRSTNCQFGNLHDNLLLVQFISGINNRCLKERLLQIPNLLTVNDVIKQCTSEALEKNSEYDVSNLTHRYRRDRTRWGDMGVRPIRYQQNGLAIPYQTRYFNRNRSLPAENSVITMQETVYLFSQTTTNDDTNKSNIGKPQILNSENCANFQNILSGNASEHMNNLSKSTLNLQVEVNENMQQTGEGTLNCPQANNVIQKENSDSQTDTYRPKFPSQLGSGLNNVNSTNPDFDKKSNVDKQKISNVLKINVPEFDGNDCHSQYKSSESLSLQIQKPDVNNHGYLMQLKNDNVNMTVVSNVPLEGDNGPSLGIGIRQIEHYNTSNTAQVANIPKCLLCKKPHLAETCPSDIIRNCRYCGESHQRRSCPAYGIQCAICGIPNHFTHVCQNKSKMYR